MKDLNPQQRDAVATTEGPLLVLAGAGSGKTRVITCRIVHLIEEAGVPPWQILAVTFTNKAAGEMKSRVERDLDASAAHFLAADLDFSFALRSHSSPQHRSVERRLHSKLHDLRSGRSGAALFAGS